MFSLLQAAAPAAAGGPAIGPQIFIMVGMVIVMYFFMLRPQAKRAKEQKKFGAAISPGETVVTTAGIHGRIQRIADDGTIQLEVARNTVLTVDRTAISMEMTAALRKKADAALTATGTAATSNTSTAIPSSAK